MDRSLLYDAGSVMGVLHGFAVFSAGEVRQDED